MFTNSVSATFVVEGQGVYRWAEVSCGRRADQYDRNQSGDSTSAWIRRVEIGSEVSKANRLDSKHKFSDLRVDRRCRVTDSLIDAGDPAGSISARNEQHIALVLPTCYMRRSRPNRVLTHAGS
jgi:hypothetical protein